MGSGTGILAIAAAHLGATATGVEIDPLACRDSQKNAALNRVSEFVETERGPIAVQGFHLGLLGVIFASDDGAVVGFAAAGATLEEGLESVRSAPGASAGYLRAVDILNRRRTPELTDLHLPKIRAEEGGSR